MEDQAAYGQSPAKELSFILDITPMGAVRTTQKGQYVSTTYKKYKDWKYTLQLLWLSEIRKLGLIPDNIKFSVIKSIDFYMPIPSGKKYLDRLGKPHTMKPDIDNMLKAFMDALMKEDSHVHEIGRMTKTWHQVGHMKVTIVLD